jgi:microcystin-dependent protein
MLTPFVGQIAMYPIGFTPSGWADCDGRLIAIQGNTALFSLLGTAYGGNGTSNFGLPDLRGRALVCYGPLPGGETYGIGKLEGAEAVLLTEQTIPQHVHRMAATSNPGTFNDPTGNLLAQAGAGLLAETVKGYIYLPDTPGTGTQLSTLSVSSNTAMPHNNMQPSLVLRYCIALQGIFPPRAAAQTA